MEEAKPPPPKEQAEKREAAVQPGGQDQKPENAVQNGDPDNDGVEDEEQPDPAANPTDDEPESSPRATVRFTRVVDGDTIEISPAVDGKDTVRLIGIDAPEEAKPGCRPQPLAEEAAGQLANWEGSEVELEFDEERADRYGRLLAYVRDDSIGIMLNEDMLLSGYVQLYIVPPNTKYEGKLREAQQESKPSPIFGESIWSLSSAEQAQLADRGNGVGSGDGACPADAQSSASASASPQPDPEPNRNRGRRNAPDYNAPSSPAPDGGGGGGCPPGAIPVPPGDDRDGDGDGCAGE